MTAHHRAPVSLSGPELRELLPYPRAVELLATAALDNDSGVIASPPRTETPLGPDWSVLMMPAATASHWGVKLLSMSPNGPARGRPYIAGAYVLFDAATGEAVCLLDGAPLTQIRTAAVSALAATRLVDADTVRLAVFGTGTQAAGHIEALGSVFTLASVHVWGSAPASAARFVSTLRLDDVPVGVGDPARLAAAEVIACCTTSATPLFAADEIGSPCVLAVGSHVPDAYELDPATVGACRPVVVEDKAIAARKAGDIVQAIRAGELDAGRLADLAELLRGELEVDGTAPRLFKSIGAAWQDLALAVAAYEGAAGPRSRPGADSSTGSEDHGVLPSVDDSTGQNAGLTGQTMVPRSTKERG